MKNPKFIVGTLLAIIFVCISTAAYAGDASTNSPSAMPPKPDLLTICPVSGDKLGEMGPPVVFVYQGQEVKLCCPDCKKDFDKDPAKYMKLIRAADKTQKKIRQ